MVYYGIKGAFLQPFLVRVFTTDFPPYIPNRRFPRENLRFGKEEGRNRYGVFAALTQTAETK